MAVKNLKVIGLPGVRVDNVDFEAATERGTPVIIVPGANARSVTEHTLVLMLTASKDIVHSDLETRNGNFNMK